jgi:hypothetical protein
MVCQRRVICRYDLKLGNQDMQCRGRRLGVVKVNVSKSHVTPVF